MIWKLFLPLLLLGQTAHAADGDLRAQLQDWGKLFDGLRGQNVEKFIPSIPFHGRDGIHHWKTPDEQGEVKAVPGTQAPEVGKSGPVGFNWLSYRDAFQDREHCAAVDVVYVKAPTVDEALSSLNECLAEVSKAYGVQVAAVKGNHEILIVLTGVIPAGSTIAADLQHALAIRKNRLYLQPARLQRIGSLEIDARTSSLQHIVNLCDGGNAAKSISSATEFLSVYAGCLKRAKGIAITNVAAHPTERFSVIVYSQDALHTLSRMNGTVTVMADRKTVRIRVHAQPDVLPEQKLDHAGYIGSAR